MSGQDQLKFAGDVNIKMVQVVAPDGFAQDITNQMSGIQIFESMYSPFITGNIVVDDTLDLINLFPFVGNEFLNLKVETPGYGKLKKERKLIFDEKFYIYKISERTLAGDKRVVYKMHFISLEALVDMNKSISAPFEGKVTDIVKTIIQKPIGLESDKNVVVESSSSGVKFVSNYWKPVEAIKYATKFAVNSNNSPSFLFFENRDGFNFVSYESLMGADPIQDFVYDKYARDFDSQGKNIKNPEAEYKRIVNITIPVVSDYMKKVRGGMFRNKMTTHDITTKQYVSVGSNFMEGWKGEYHLNDHPLMSTKTVARSSAHGFFRPKAYGNYNGYVDSTNAQTAQLRRSLMQALDAHKIEVEVPGRTDYTVGKKVYVKLYKNTPVSDQDNSKETIDHMFSGYYLIANINHVINRTGHTCHMDLVKDSLIYDLDGGRK